MFSAGLSTEYSESAAYITVHSVRNDSVEERSTILYDKSSHKQKKGFYRLESLVKSRSLSASVEVLVAATWLDVCVFSFNGSEIQHIYTYKRLNTDLIYNLITFKKEIYVCSNDCTINKIELF